MDYTSRVVTIKSGSVKCR